jgi:hypothetical protein
MAVFVRHSMCDPHCDHACETLGFLLGPCDYRDVSTTTAKADFHAYQDSIRLSPAEVVGRLRDILGARLVAYLGSVKETRAVRQWAEGDRTPSAEVVLRLRTAYHAAALLREKDSPPVVQAWFQGMNPRLDDVSPARLLRDGNLDQVGPSVLAAARAFAAEG